MGIRDDLNSEVRKIFGEEWSERPGRVIPESNSLKLRNDAITLDGTVLYADLDDSTKLVDTSEPWFAAEMYRSYLACAARIIRLEHGEITAYDGDRVMAVFLGSSKNSDATRAALKINFAVQKIINPAIQDLYPDTCYSIKHVVGIDTSELFVARTGIRGANDLVWVGRAANYAAKLSSRAGPATQITDRVYGLLNRDSKLGDSGQNMWNPATASEINNMRVYTSSWTWEL